MAPRSGAARRGIPALLMAAGLAAALVAGPASPARAATAPGVWGWGENMFGEVGSGAVVQYDVPVPVTLPATPVQVAMRGFDSAAVLPGGTLDTWGENNYGQLGIGGTTGHVSAVAVPGLTGVTQVAVGWEHMLALDSSGRVWSWGDNTYGELGNGTTSSVRGSNPTPVPVPGLAGVTQVAAGAAYSLALKSDGTVWAWGDNDKGQLGDGTTISRDLPEKIASLTGVTRLVAGAAASYAIQAGGTLLAWGDASSGLLGNGATQGFSATPAPVRGLTGVTAVATSQTTTLAVTGPSGLLWGWGQNYYGQVGDGTATPRYFPTQTSLTGVTQVASGAIASGAVLTSGQLMTWGSNADGELGQSAVTTPVPAPAPVATLAGVTQLVMGDFSALAVGSPAPRIPSVIGNDQAGAAAILQAAGFRLGRVALVVDITCDYIGEVKTQSPVAGTLAQPGTAVNVTIGKPGGKCL